MTSEFQRTPTPLPFTKSRRQKDMEAWVMQFWENELKLRWVTDHLTNPELRTATPPAKDGFYAQNAVGSIENLTEEKKRKAPIPERWDGAVYNNVLLPLAFQDFTEERQQLLTEAKSKGFSANLLIEAFHAIECTDEDIKQRFLKDFNQARPDASQPDPKRVRFIFVGSEQGQEVRALTPTQIGGS